MHNVSSSRQVGNKMGFRGDSRHSVYSCKYLSLPVVALLLAVMASRICPSIFPDPEI